MSKILLTIEQVRFIWSLGFTSGRVQEASSPKQGVTWYEETPIFESDLARVASANKQLSKKLRGLTMRAADVKPRTAQEELDQLGEQLAANHAKLKAALRG